MLGNMKFISHVDKDISGYRQGYMVKTRNKFHISAYPCIDVKSVLHISSAHNKGRPTDTYIAQILHLSNFSIIKNLVYMYSIFI